MLKTPLFSIIIPAYNAEKFIRATLDSITNQTYKNWELIVVDDCSTDNSFVILQDYAVANNNIKVFQLPANTGSAQQPIKEALSRVLGEYVIMMGHDDELSSNYLELMQARIEETHADCVLSICLFKNSISSKIVKELPKKHINRSKIYSGREACLLTMLKWQLGANGMAVKRELCINAIQENTGTYMNSDELSTRLILIHAKSVAFSKSEYVYWQVESSITHKNSVKLYETLYVDVQLIDFANHYYGLNLAAKMYAQMVNQMMRLCRKYASIRGLYSQEEQNRIINILRTNYAYIYSHKKYAIGSIYNFAHNTPLRLFKLHNYMKRLY